MAVGPQLFNLARMTVTSTGTGTITLNAAVSGFLTFDLAGCSTASTGQVVTYAINDTTQSEIAIGTYTSSSVTLTRGSSTQGMKSTNSNSPIDMTNSAQVFITPNALRWSTPTFQKLTSGSTATYTTPTNCTWIKVQMIGGGGGGGGSGSASLGSGGTGGATSFSTYSAAGGIGAVGSGAGSGGTGISTTTTSWGITGGVGEGGVNGSAAEVTTGGRGGAAAVIGQFNSGSPANTGCGGPGGNVQVAAGVSGGGGGGGAYTEVILPSSALAATFTYTIGAGGTAGTAGTGGAAGVAGTTGLILVYEYYD